jgi:acetylornithine deacetylase/succinyl-diaminopimelate desuccinylase-like protein
MSKLKTLRYGLSSALVAAALMASSSVVAQEAAAEHVATVDAILADSQFETAVEYMRDNYDQQIEEFVELVEIPSGPFMEAEISARYAELLEVAGLENVHVDEEGNAIGEWRGTNSDGDYLVVSAHLDTVFPEGTDVTVNWIGTEAHAPGVGDDTMSLAVILSYIRAMKEAGIETEKDILFVGTVGEEGPGDLRGVRYLFTEGEYKDNISAFFSIEGGTAGRITAGGTGSLRYRVTFEGPGGHSYGAFGTVNPSYALANFMTAFSEIEVPEEPKTTHNVGIIEGGTSVNSIPFSMAADVDMRSEDPDELEKVHQQFLALVDEAAAYENERNSTENGEITVNLELIGDRPAGQTDRESELFQITHAGFTAAGYEVPEPGTGSTDSNMPMSLDIPALTIGANSGRGGRGHSLDEWLDTDIELTIPAMRATLAVVLANAGYVQE